MKRIALIVAAAAVLPWLSGCGESTDVTVYKQGKYQGKPDTAAWDNDQFKGDKVAWEAAIRKRNAGQNEYSRGTPTPN